MNIAFKFINDILDKYGTRDVIIMGTGHKAMAVYNYMRAINKETHILFFAKLLDERDVVHESSLSIRDAYDILYYIETAVIIVANDNLESGVSFLNRLSNDIVFEKWPFDVAKNCNFIDPLLGYSRQDTLPGYTIYNGEENATKIMILGGSTSDSTFDNQRSWPEILFNKYKAKATIYNGAIVGYNSSQELLKLCRDISIIKPDIVISYSGINDCYRGTMDFIHPFTPPYYSTLLNNEIDTNCDNRGSFSGLMEINLGLDNCRTPDKVWIDNEKKMFGICYANNIRFVGVFQASLFTTGYHIADEEKRYLNYRHSSRAIKEFCKYVGAIESHIQKGTETYLYSLEEAVHGMKYLFYDHCHGGDDLNTIIADNIFNILEQK